MYARDLQSELARGRARPVYVFAGGSEEEYREAVERLKKAVLAPGMESFNYASFSGRETTAGDILASARTQAFGQGGRLTVLREPKGLGAEGTDRLVEFVHAPAEGNCLVVVAEEPDRKLKLLREAASAGALVDFRPPRRESRSRQIVEDLRRHGLRADAEALAALEAALSEDRGLVNRELEKLALYMGDRKDIAAGDLGDILVDWSYAGAWDLSNHLQAGRTVEALRTIDRLLEEGEEPVRLLGVLARIGRQLLAAGFAAGSGGESGPGSAELRGLPPGVVQALKAEARRRPRRRLLEAHLALKRVDRLLKSTQLPPRLLLEAALAGFLAERLAEEPFPS